MRFWTSAKRGLLAITAPGIFLGLIAYFLLSATQGERGLQASAVRQAQLKALQAELANTQAEERAWQRRVAEMTPSHLDPDMLDERARATSDYAEANDVIVQLQPSQRLVTRSDQ